MRALHGERWGSRAKQLAAQHTQVKADLCSFLDNVTISQKLLNMKVSHGEGKKNNEAVASIQETAPGASITSFPVMNFNSIFTSVFCCFPELHQCSWGMGSGLGFADTAPCLAYCASLPGAT